MEIRIMDAITGRLIENGFAFIAFLTVVITFVWKVVTILDRRMADIVVEVRALVNQQRGDSERLIATIEHHDERTQARYDNMARILTEHHQSVLHYAEEIRVRNVEADAENKRIEH